MALWSTLTMTKCTSAGNQIHVEQDASLVMDNGRVFSCGDSGGSNSNGVRCDGNVKATRCTFEDNGGVGVIVRGLREGMKASGELVDCVFRKNALDGVIVYEGKVMLRGRMICENERNGAFANHGQLTVAEAEEGKPQTVSTDNKSHDWRTQHEK